MTQTILVVDDTPHNLRLLTDMLRTYGYQTRVATSGHQAIESIALSPPDLILLDIKMPDMTGYEVCRSLKRQAETKDIPVIFISALDELFDKVIAFQIGGVDYITKPFQKEEVLVRIETHLSLQQHRKQLEQARSTLEDKVRERTMALSTANVHLEQEVTRRKQNEADKAHLLAITRQQSEQLRTLMNALITTQTSEQLTVSLTLIEDALHQVASIQTSLGAIKTQLDATQITSVQPHLNNIEIQANQFQQTLNHIFDTVQQTNTQTNHLAESPLLKLTTREREVLQLLVEGKSVVQISEMLSLSRSSVRTYHKRIKEKLDIYDMPGLVKFALTHELIA